MPHLIETQRTQTLGWLLEQKIPGISSETAIRTATVKQSAIVLSVLTKGNLARKESIINDEVSRQNFKFVADFLLAINDSAFLVDKAFRIYADLSESSFRQGEFLKKLIQALVRTKSHPDALQMLWDMYQQHGKTLSGRDRESHLFHTQYILFLVAENGPYDIILSFWENELDIGPYRAILSLALNYAVMQNEHQVADALLAKGKKAGIDINASTVKLKSPWLCAAENKNVSEETIAWLLQQKDIDLNVVFGGKTAFQIALECKHPVFIKLMGKSDPPLLANFLAQQLKNNKSSMVQKTLVEIYKAGGDMPGLLAAIKEKIELEVYHCLIGEFFEHAAKILVEKDDVNTLQFLLQYNRDLVYYDSESTIGHLAAQSNKPELMKLLIREKGLDALKHTDSEGNVPLQLAAKNKAWKAIAVIAECKTDDKDEAGYNIALLHAIKAGQHDLAVKLLNTNAKPTFFYEKGPGCLQWAAFNNDLLLINTIVQHSVDINHRRDDQSMTALVFAAIKEKISVATVKGLLAQKNIDLDYRYEGKTALDYAVGTKQFEKIVLLANSKKIPLPDLIKQKEITSSSFIASILKVVYQEQDSKSVLEFIDQLAKNSTKDKLDLAFLKDFLKQAAEMIVARQDISLLQSLEKIDPGSINLIIDDHQNTLLHLAAENNSEAMVTALIETGAEVDHKNKEGHTAFLKAALEKNWEVVGILINQRGIVPESEQVLLLAAQELGSTNNSEKAKALVEKLLAANVAPSASQSSDDPRLTALHYAILNNETKLAEAMLAKNPGMINSKADTHSPTPLLSAMQDVNVSWNTIFWLLTQPGVDLTQPYKGKTALEFCYQSGNRRIKSELLKEPVLIKIISAQVKNGDIGPAMELLCDYVTRKVPEPMSPQICGIFEKIGLPDFRVAAEALNSITSKHSKQMTAKKHFNLVAGLYNYIHKEYKENAEEMKAWEKLKTLVTLVNNIAISSNKDDKRNHAIQRLKNQANLSWQSINFSASLENLENELNAFYALDRHVEEINKVAAAYRGKHPLRLLAIADMKQAANNAYYKQDAEPKSLVQSDADLVETVRKIQRDTQADHQAMSTLTWFSKRSSKLDTYIGKLFNQEEKDQKNHLRAIKNKS